VEGALEIANKFERLESPWCSTLLDGHCERESGPISLDFFFSSNRFKVAVSHMPRSCRLGLSVIIAAHQIGSPSADVSCERNRDCGSATSNLASPVEDHSRDVSIRLRTNRSVSLSIK
jgi:hypothetical protein